MKAFQLKITIKDTHPPIWRRVIVPAGLSFNQLTVVLNTAMGWSGYHLSSYTFQSFHVEFEDCPDESFSAWNSNEILDASEYIIDDYVEQVKSFTYIYDFGDYWDHQVHVEKVTDDYENSYPTVIKFKGGCPKEDCGGVWGYEELIRILGNPDDPEHEEMMEWSGGHAENEFDQEFVNKKLAKLKLSEEASYPMSLHDIYDDYLAGKPFKKITKKKKSGKSSENTVLKFPGADSGFQADVPDEEWYDKIPDGFGEILLDATLDLALARVIHLLKKNTTMTEAEIKKALELDNDEFKFLKKLIKDMEQDNKL